MAELITQELFGSSNDFPNENRIGSVQKDKRLKPFFHGLSKTGNGGGIPDAVYLFENKTLMVVEIKPDNMSSAVSDVKHYYRGLRKNGYNDDIVSIAFTGNGHFRVFENENEIFPESLTIVEFNFKLKNKLFGDKLIYKYNINHTKEQMDKQFYKIHNYIRDNCHLSSREKIILIIGILVALKEPYFNKEWFKYYDNSLLNQFLFDSIKKINSGRLSLNDTDERIKNFLFIKTHESFKESNKLHEIIKLVVDIQNLNYTGDLVNLFYSEFVKYSDSDGQVLGIVLTPEYIVELMVYMIDINKDDIVLDLCTGTGSFLLESLKHNPKKIMGCEMQNDLFLMAETNFILRDVYNYELIKGNCFNHTFVASKSIINPPFGQKKVGEKELDFVIKQIESTKNGLCVAVFPQSCISNNKQNLKLKQKIMELSTIKTVIKLNNKVFYPNASVGCSIMLLDTTKPHDSEKDSVLFIDFTNDEYENMIHNGRLKTANFDKHFDLVKNILKYKTKTEISFNCFIKSNDEWSFDAFVKINFSITKNELKEQLKTYNKLFEKEEKKEIVHFKSTEMFKICDIFDIETVKKSMQTNYAKKNNGSVPYISASKLNNGITFYTKNNSNFSLIEPECLTLVNAGDGGCGYTFYQRVPFYASSSIYILRFKEKYFQYKNNICVNMFMCSIISKLHEKYGFNRGLKMNKLIGDEGEEIELPVNEFGEINFELIQTLYDE
jgi:predicted RNA methylase